MRKLYVFNMITLDGYFEGPGRDISWHNVDEEFNDFAVTQLDQTDLILFGRVTYELMAGYWPTSAARTDDPVIAGKMNGIRKVVFSATLKGADWENTRQVSANAVEEIKSLKEQPGKDIGIFGSSDLAVTLIPHGVIDEHRLMVNPVVLGAGKRLYERCDDKLQLKRIKIHTFQNGNVLLYYQPMK